MRKVGSLLIVFIVASGLCALAAHAQVTNIPSTISLPIPLTELEIFEAQTGTVIITGSGLVGSLMLDAFKIQLHSRESQNVTTSLRQYGMLIEASAKNEQVWKKVVDYDEMDALINGLNTLTKIDYQATSEPTFAASYITRSGLQAGAFTSQRHGTIQYFLKDYSTNSARIVITSSQLGQFRDLVDETRKHLESLQAAH